MLWHFAINQISCDITNSLIDVVVSTIITSTGAMRPVKGVVTLARATTLLKIILLPLSPGVYPFGVQVI